MLGNDISNGTPPTILVHVDVCTLRETVETKRLFGLLKGHTQIRRYDKLVLNALWRYAYNNGVTLELFEPGASQKEMDDIFDDLDRVGVNPFRRARIATTLRDVVASLPMEPNTLGVIDIPDRGLTYGSKWIDRLSL